MTALLIGYARCSTDQQDLTAQRDGLAALGSVYDPADPAGRLLFNVLAMVAKFADAIRAVRAATGADEPDEAGRLECQWQRGQLPDEVRELVLRSYAAKSACRIDLCRGRQAVYRPSATAALTRSHALRVWALSAS